MGEVSDDEFNKDFETLRLEGIPYVFWTGFLESDMWDELVKTVAPNCGQSLGGFILNWCRNRARVRQL